MKKLKLSLLFVSFLSTQVLATGIPTVDAAAIAQMVNQIMEMKKQYEQMQKDYEQYTQMNENMSGVSGNGNIFNEDALNDLFPDYQEAIENVIEMGVSGLSGEAKSIYEAKHLGVKCSTLSSPLKEYCEKEAALTAVKEANYKQSLETIELRRDNINKLLEQASKAQSQKQIADLQVRLQGEVAFLQAQQIKADLTRNYIRAQQEAVEIQRQNTVDILTDVSQLSVDDLYK